MPSTEKWRDVKGYEGLYKVSDTGKIRSVGRYKQAGNQYRSFSYWVRGRELRFSTDKDGYSITSLTKDGVKKNFKVHRIVAEAFIPNEESKPLINHKDSDRANNSLYNLEWCTAKENAVHASEEGNLTKGEQHSKSSLTQTECGFIEYWLDLGFSPKEIGGVFNVSRSLISQIKLNKHWSNRGKTLCQA